MSAPPAVCVKCGHGGIAIAPLTVARGRAVRVVLATGDPPALLSGAADASGVLEARVCTGCGYAEIYARDPRRLSPVVRSRPRG